ncbi:SDR family oxidoreductase [Roseibium aggregatum]|uniref:SDR family oxidoreductase n=1 Tax=Roseibium aggregatum TaxID=187304 RepID=A0A939EJJ3_9HYPH|nr:SDR family oxidoreductase [Roseibium aggregatum]MBN9672850.1 SDR family oxidoreductase [Roseibium aggregatum]
MSDSVVIVTGGSRGIGASVCRKLGALGHTVIVNYAGNEAAATDVVTTIESAGGAATAVQADVGSEQDVIRLFETADTLGTLKGLVNNAGVVDRAMRVEDMLLDRLTRMVNINLIGTFLCAREAVRRMSTKNGGQGGTIVNLGSAASKLGSPGMYVDYAATKGAIDTMTVGLAGEVALEGIRVNAVRPGIIDTEIHASGGAPDRVEKLQSQLPMKRAGTADEVAEAIVWLMSDQSSYTTGAILDVSGGRAILP